MTASKLSVLKHFALMAIEGDKDRYTGKTEQA